MPTLDLSIYDQPQGSTSDGTKYDNMLTAIQGTINALDHNNLAANAGILASQLADPGTGRVLGSSGGACAAVYMGGVYRKTTAKTVNTSVTETDLLNSEITVGANVLGTDLMLRLTARGDWKQNSGAGAPAPRFKLKLGGTTLLDTGVIPSNTFGNSASRFGWRIDATIANLGATNAQWADMAGIVTGIVAVADNAPFTVGEGGYWTPNTGSNTGAFLSGANTGAVDTTGACALVLSVINGANNANYEVVLKHATVEVV